MQDRRQALPNQIDYLLLRAGQEHSIRQAAGVGVVDGGLDQDFYVFTRLFYAKGYLDEAGFELCQRLYRQLRQLLAPPDLVLKLNAPLEALKQRRAARSRALDIVSEVDLPSIDDLLADWLQAGPPPAPLIEVDASAWRPVRLRPALFDQSNPLIIVRRFKVTVFLNLFSFFPLSLVVTLCLCGNLSWS